MATTDPSYTGPMTHAQGQRLIALLEGQSRGRHDLRQRAEQASRVLDTLAMLVVVVGAVGILVSFVLIARLGPLEGLVVLVGIVVMTGVYWGLLQTASVVAGYVANRLPD